MGDLSSLAQTGAPLWLLWVILLLGAAASAAPKILGPLGQIIEHWTSGRKRAAVEVAAQEAEARRTEAAELRQERDRARADLHAAEERIWRHRLWDFQAMSELPNDFPPPPDLLGSAPTKETP